MNGDPVDPISYEQSIRELWSKLAASKNIDLQTYLLRDDEGDEWGHAAHIGSLLQYLRGEAELRILGLVTCGLLRAWLSDRDEWTRPTEKMLQERLLNNDDMPRGLEVDRHQLEDVIAERWPELAHMQTAHVISKKGGKANPTKGRPIGSGTYAKSDAPLLLEIGDLLETGIARSVHQASMMVAERALGGGTIESKARRLRNAYRSELADKDAFQPGS